MCKNTSIAELMLLSLIIAVLSFSGCISTEQETPSPSPSQPSVPTPNIPEPAPPAIAKTPFTLPPGIDLVFEMVGYNNAVYQYRGKSAQIQVVTDNYSPLPAAIDWVSPKHKTEILAVDYSRYFIILAFHGWRAWGAGVEVKRIWQNRNVVYVMASFIDPGSQPGATMSGVFSSSYNVVKVSKNKMSEFGDLTFIILDQKGEERATTIASVNK